MQLQQHRGVLYCLLPLAVLLVGIVRIQPEAAQDARQTWEQTQRSLTEFGVSVLAKCRGR